MLTPGRTYGLLLLVQALHLLHHRITKRHISHAEVISAVLLCVPLSVALSAWWLMSAHLALIAAPVFHLPLPSRRIIEVFTAGGLPCAAAELAATSRGNGAAAASPGAR